MDMKLKDKRIFITGGTSGIGLAAAKLFLAEGAKVVIMGRSASRGKQALSEIANPNCYFFSGDVRSLADCQIVISEAALKLGSLDVLVNSAGIYLENAIEDTTAEQLDDILATNVKGTYYMCQAAMSWLKSSQGSIVNVASDAGIKGNYYCTAYCASKGAVVAFTKALALETAGFGMRVNAIAPGDIMTPLTEAQLAEMPDRAAGISELASVYPLGRIGTAKEAASAIIYLASPIAGFVTGTVLSVDGGLTA